MIIRYRLWMLAGENFTPEMVTETSNYHLRIVVILIRFAVMFTGEMGKQRVGEALPLGLVAR